MQHYSDISLPTLTAILDSAKWFWKSDANSTEADWVLSCYTPGNSIAGWTDYTNHITAAHTMDHYKAIVYKEIETRLLQIGNYYNINGAAFDCIVIVRTRSGWSAEAVWSNGDACYFKHIYAESAKKYAEQRAQEESARKARAKARRDEKRALAAAAQPKPAKKKSTTRNRK